MKAYLTGMPECKFGINDKLLMANEAKQGKKSVELNILYVIIFPKPIVGPVQMVLLWMTLHFTNVFDWESLNRTELSPSPLLMESLN